MEPARTTVVPVLFRGCSHEHGVQQAQRFLGRIIDTQARAVDIDGVLLRGFAPVGILDAAPRLGCAAACVLLAFVDQQVQQVL